MTAPNNTVDIDSFPETAALRDRLPAVLLDALPRVLAETAEPERALRTLLRFAEADADASCLNANPAHLRTLCILFDQSPFLSDILCRNPGHALWLLNDAVRDRARTRDDILDDLLRVPDALQSYDASFKFLRRFRQRAILRIATREIADHAPISSTTEDLSNLADATLEAALMGAQPEIIARFGTPRCSDDAPCGFVILGMGKLGGRELNFSSDIDLIFLYTDDGETTGGRSGSISNAEYFQKIGERIIKLLSEPSPEGFLFRVDMRLRPHGQTGPLAVGLEAGIDYYSTYGRAWERQALLKARPCAGDLALGETFLAQTRSFVFPKFFDDATLEDIRDTKRQLEQRVARQGLTEREVKLGRGGIRDIEFTVQILQLLHGGRAPGLRAKNTLDAITALGQYDCLRPFDAEVLARHYAFLRRVEHRLQIEGGQQRHALPEDGTALDTLARRLGYESGAAFMNVYRDRTEEVRRILDQFLSDAGGGHLWVGDLLNPHSDGEAGRAALAEHGFREPARAREELLHLALGPDAAPHRRHVRRRFAQIAPTLIDALAESSDPDRVLMRLGQILGRFHAPGVLYDLLQSAPTLCAQFVTLVSNSDYLGQLLVRDPGLLDLISDPAVITTPSRREDLDAELQLLLRAATPDAALYRLRDGELLRVAMRDLIYGATVAQVGDALTQLAEVILEQVLHDSRRKAAARHGGCDARFCVLGLGKLGGLEMGYGSDLDILFVYEDGHAPAGGMAASEYFAAAASRAVKTLKEPTRHGALYDIDMRLRPDGNKGVLAAGSARLAAYYENEAQPWERLALMKVRAVAGDAGFAAETEAAMKDIAFSMPLNSAALDHIETLRRQLSEKATIYDVKKFRGGINEVEFIVRLHQLRHAAAYPQLKRGDVYAALDIFAEHGLVSADAIEVLRAAYTTLRRILNRVRMMTGRDTTVIPEDEAGRAGLARRLGIAEDLLGHIEGHRIRVHNLYQETFNTAREETR